MSLLSQGLYNFYLNHFIKVQDRMIYIFYFQNFKFVYVLKKHLETEHNRKSLLPANIELNSPALRNCVVILERSVGIDNAIVKGLTRFKINQGRSGRCRWPIH